MVEVTAWIVFDEFLRQDVLICIDDLWLSFFKVVVCFVPDVS